MTREKTNCMLCDVSLMEFMMHTRYIGFINVFSFSIRECVTNAEAFTQLTDSTMDLIMLVSVGH